MTTAAFLAKILPKRDFNANHAYFFYFVTWYSLIFLMVSVVFTDIFRRIKFKPWVVFMKPNKKKNWNLWGTPLGPRASAPALGPSGVPQRFQFIFLLGFMKPPKVSILSCEKYPWNHWNHQKYQWNQITKKKNAWFLFKTSLFGLFFWQKQQNKDDVPRIKNVTF